MKCKFSIQELNEKIEQMKYENNDLSLRYEKIKEKLKFSNEKLKLQILENKNLNGKFIHNFNNFFFKILSKI